MSAPMPRRGELNRHDPIAERRARQEWERKHSCTGEAKTCFCPEHVAARIEAGGYVHPGDLPFD